ncbi:SMP-30/gluconolactonase/LRE family protein [Microvirga pudoricolor]|uniref:SMP-30/gluconolactonase/LRE family protein n=1 Tax=Microvirga pudoricolor TaxID=2778729 RepID=UPI001951DEE6|nr:SMP-30/gluconolactonase/LRE family protein [Microvirga pudoricolor]MBM6594786.1 SMP-30/gluconolactonase/LRE family protein [Microvirga pudoricolor]
MSHPTVHPQIPHVAVASGCILGEGALWDHRTGTVLWVDIKNPAVWQFHPETGKHSRLDVKEPVGFVALTSDPDIVIAGFQSGLSRLHLWGGETQPLVEVEADLPDNRLNDGHVGPDGRLYFGTMDNLEENETGCFWRWDGKDLVRFHGNMVVTNGPASSHDGRTLYTTDTTNGQIYAHVLGDGLPGAPSRFTCFEEGWGHPDGMTVDAEGHVWVCHWGGSRITRFAPDGSVERILPVPTAQVTKCAFGGPDMTTLYITTASIGHDPAIDPMAGHLFSVETGIRGQHSHIFGE